MLSKEQIAINRLMCGNTAHSCKADYIKLAINALEKQVLKKVNLYIGNDAVCPSCNKRLRGYEGMKIAYCKFCGQLIKGEGVMVWN